MNKSMPGMSNSSMSSQSAHRSGGASASTGMTGKGHKARNTILANVIPRQPRPASKVPAGRPTEPPGCALPGRPRGKAARNRNE
jgi:hypothetical protein